jgi:hypothetical protein
MLYRFAKLVPMTVAVLTKWKFRCQQHADNTNVQMIATRIDGRRRRERQEYTAVYDDRDHPLVGGAASETVAELRTDYYRVKTTTKVGGRITDSGTRLISKDRKTMTITVSSSDQRGAVADEALIFRKR